MALITGVMWDIDGPLITFNSWPDSYFTTGQAYGWAVAAPSNVWADTAGTTPGVFDATIRRLDDERGDPWVGVTTGPTYRNTGGVYWLEFAQIDGRQLQITVPEITNGTLMIAHKNAGVLSGNVTIPAGTYAYGRWDDHGIVGVLLIDRDLSQSERNQMRQWFITERGAGSFSGVTSLTRYCHSQLLTGVDLFDTSSVTSFDTAFRSNLLASVPLFDTSSGTNFDTFLYDNQLTTVPLFDTSSGTVFNNFLSENATLTTIPAGLFDDIKGTSFINAFFGCALTQASVDNVLVSIAVAAAANNLNNGTLNLDSGTNATPSATGVAAKNDLVARGWTVTTN